MAAPWPPGAARRSLAGRSVRIQETGIFLLIKNTPVLNGPAVSPFIRLLLHEP